MRPDIGSKRNPKNFESITNHSDAWLLREWRQGDEKAAQVLFDRYALRLSALVASRLNRRFQSECDPNEIVQSAMGSFFNAAKRGRIQASQNVSLWRLLATFTRRKMARTIERQSAAKRGGHQKRIDLEDVTLSSTTVESDSSDADELIEQLQSHLDADLFAVVERLLAGQSHREIAAGLGIDERTVRRRIARIRDRLQPLADDGDSNLNPAKGREIPLPLPRHLPRVGYNEFVLGKLMGTGAFGKVYRARLQVDGQPVAVKFLRKAFWQDKDARQSYLREIETASQIDHPGVLKYIGYGVSPQGGPYVLSQWIDGQSLEFASRPDKKRFNHWLLQICDAIKAVHGAGMVHGDLSPGNILVDQHDRITVIDFGFSHSYAKKQPSFLGGTVGFAAPEQIDLAFGEIGPRTDLYAIGGLVHWYLFQETPHSGTRVTETLLRTIEKTLPESTRHAQDDTKLSTIMRRSLSPSPADRSMTLEEMIDLLSLACGDRHLPGLRR